MGVSVTTKEASAGTEIVFAKYVVALAPVGVRPFAAAVPMPSTYKFKSAAALPSTFAHTILLIFNSFSASTVNKVAVKVLDKAQP
jgi:hypothetical protein